MKKCSTCKIEKSEREFYKCNKSKDGYRSNCKACRAISQKKCDEKNEEKRRITKKTWEERNKERLRELSKDWKLKNREKVLESSRVYARKRYSENKEQERERHNKWIENNLEKYRESERKSKKKRYDNNKELHKELSNKWKLENPKRVKELARKHSKISKERFPHKAKAVSKVSSAIRNGTLTRPTQCSRCDNTDRIEGHHPDYNKPLEVIWLCKKCHIAEHKILTNA